MRGAANRSSKLRVTSPRQDVWIKEQRCDTSPSRVRLEHSTRVNKELSNRLKVMARSGGLPELISLELVYELH